MKSDHLTVTVQKREKAGSYLLDDARRLRKQRLGPFYFILMMMASDYDLELEATACRSKPAVDNKDGQFEGSRQCSQRNIRYLKKYH